MRARSAHRNVGTHWIDGLLFILSAKVKRLTGVIDPSHHHDVRNDGIGSDGSFVDPGGSAILELEDGIMVYM